MENQDIDLLGETVGKMFYKIGIVDKDGKVTNQFVANASTNRVDIPQAVLEKKQIPSTTNLFSGSAVGDILLSGPSANYDNIQDGLLITLDNPASQDEDDKNGYAKAYLSLKPIKIPKEKLVVNSSFDISDQLSQYIGQRVSAQYYRPDNMAWNYLPGPFYIEAFGGTTIKVLPNTTLSMNLSVAIKSDGGAGSDPGLGGDYYGGLKIAVRQVNTYKN